MLAPIKKRIKLIDGIGAATVVTVVALAGLGGFAPLYRSARANERQATEFRQHLGKLDGLSKTLGQVEGDLKNTESRLADTETQLPSSNPMDDFMRQLAKVAEETGVQLDAVTPRKLLDAGEYKVQPFDIAGTGSFESCYKLLVGVRHMNRMTRLDDLTLVVDSQDPHAPPKNVCHMTLVISTFMAR